MCSVLLLPCFADTKNSDTPPLIHILDTIQTLDTLLDGDTTTVPFSFVNVANRVIEISDIRASCGCIETSADTQIYHPGDTGSVSVVFSSSGFSGPIYRKVIITARSRDDNSAVQTEKVALRTYVKTEIVFLPSSLIETNVVRRDTTAFKVLLANSTDHPVRLVSLAIDDTVHFDLHAQFLPMVLKSEQSYNFSVLYLGGSVDEEERALKTVLTAETEQTVYRTHYLKVRVMFK
jgi:hypothetical protein